MEIGRHIGKGTWALADKSLPVLYGVGFVFLVIRILPKEEFGIYVLIQNAFLLLVAMGTSFALQPMVKYAAETDDPASIAAAGSWMYAIFVMGVSFLIIVFKSPLSRLFHAPSFASLAWFLPIMLLVSFVRTVALALFQSKVLIQQMFWVNTVYFVGSLVAIAALLKEAQNQTASVLLVISTSALAASSLLALILVRGSFPRGGWRKVFSFEAERGIVIKTWNYGKFSFGASSMYALFTQGDSFVIASILGPVSVALYNAARVFTRIFDVILQVIVTFLVPTSSRLSSQKNSVELIALAEKSTFVFMAGVLPISVLLCLFAPEILSVFYRDRYAEAVPLLRILALSGLAVPLIGVASSFLFGIGKVYEVFITSLINTIIAILLFAVGTYMWGVNGAAWTMVFVSLFTAFTYGFTLIRFANVPLRVKSIVLRYRDAVNFVRKLLLEKVRGQFFPP